MIITITIAIEGMDLWVEPICMKVVVVIVIVVIVVVVVVVVVVVDVIQCPLHNRSIRPTDLSLTML